MKICSTENCGRKHRCKGLCALCYQDFRKTKGPQRKCSFEGCGNLLRVDNTLGVCTACSSSTGLHRQHRRANDSEWAALDKERARAYEAKRDRTPATLLRKRQQRRQSNTGMSPEMVEMLRDIQHGRCAICLVTLLMARGHATSECADHFELLAGLRVPAQTPKSVRYPRGLLCTLCNVGLGMYEAGQRPAGLVIDPYEKYLSNPPTKQLADTISLAPRVQLP